MIADVSHHFFLTLNQFVPSVQVFRDEFLQNNCVRSIDVNLVEYLIYNLASRLFVSDLLVVDEVIVQFISIDNSIRIDINLSKLIDELLLHVVIESCLLDTLVNRV